MGLDTVDLIVRIEKEFEIVMTDDEAIRTFTVGDIANLIYLKKEIIDGNKDIFRELFFRLKEIFIKLGIKEEIICINTELIELIPLNKYSEYKKYIEGDLGIELPNLKLKYNSDSEIEDIKLFGIKIYKRNKQLRDYTLFQMINCIVSLNYKELIDLKNIHTKYEVERVISMIVSDQSGLKIEQIELYHYITKDLGMY